MASGPVPIGAEKLSGAAAVKANIAQLGSFRPVLAALLLSGCGVWGGAAWGTSLDWGKPSLLSPVVLALDSGLTQFFMIWGMFYHKILGLKQE